MNPKNWFDSGRSASLVAGILLCGLLLAQGISSEVPVGGIDGTAVMTENGRPIEGAMVVLRPVDVGTEDLPSRRCTTDEKGRFALRHLQAGNYMVEASANAHRFGPELVTIPEGQKYVVELGMKPIEPYMNVLASQKVFTPSEKASIQLDGFAPKSALNVSLYKMDFQKVVAKGSLDSALGPLAGRYGEKAVDPATMGTEYKSFTRDLENVDAEGVFEEGVQFDPLPEGIYWVRCKVGGLIQGTYLNVTKIALVTKNVGTAVTCYVTGIDTGKPVEGAQVGYGAGGKFVQSGLTDAHGVAQLTAKTDNEHRTPIIAIHGESKALADFYVQSGSGGPFRIFTYTDRPIYRPGDKVSFKGIVRRLEGERYTVPPPAKAAIEVRDSDDSLLQSMTLPVSAMGTFNGNFAFNDEAAPGGYQLIVRYGGLQETHYVNVASYQKPEFSISVEPERPYYIRGQQARAVVKCAYYFGGPVVGAEVTVNIARQPYWSWMEDEGDEEESQEDAAPMAPPRSYGGGEGYDEIKAVTDEKGEAVIEFDTVLPDDPKEAEQDYVYNLYASVKDQDNKYFDGTGTVKVVRGDIDLAILLDTYFVGKGEQARFRIKAKNQEDGSPASGLRVELRSETEVWTGEEASGVDVQTQEVVLGTDGTAEVTVTPRKSGSLKLTARAHGVVERNWVYVEGDESGGSGPKPPRLSIKLDKRSYAVGGTAKAMIETDSPGGSMLLTLEGDRLYSTQVVELKNKVTMVSLPVDRVLAPNAFVCGAYVKGKKFAEATKRLVVDLGERILKVDVKSDKGVYHPGDVATYRILTTSDGKPVPAELSLGVVDESIYAIAQDDTNIVEGFFPKRQNRVNTSYSFPEIYLDGGDKAPASVKVRREFKDTAYWNPTIVTDASGRATVAVKLPDNLTKWRATAVAVTADTRVGSTTQGVVARKDLMVRLSAPAFMVQTDRQRLVAMIQNNTGADADVHLELTVQGASVSGDLRQSVRIDNGSQKSVAWDVHATNSGAAVFVAKVWTDASTSDGVELRVPIKPHGRQMQEQASGDLRDKASFRMVLYDGADPSTGRLRISITPSIASALTESLDDLIGFPYGCTEQTMSRFMPTVVVSKALKDLKLPPPAQAPLIPKMVADGFTKLRAMQHNDGGWGWWENDASDPFMTAYVLEGYVLAADAGYEANPFSESAAVKWAKARVPEAAKLKRKDVLYLAYALSLYSENAAAATALGNIKFDVRRATPSEAAWALMTYANLGKAYTAQRDAALQRLLALAQGSGGIRYWREDDSWGVETSARCLLAIAKVKPDHPILSQVARYMMLSRRGSMWTSTRDTAYAIIGLTKVMKSLTPAKPGSVVTVKVNGREAARFTLTPEALNRPGFKVDVPVGGLKAGDNLIEMQQSGASPGVLYYTADLTQTVVSDQLGEMLMGSGLRVQRAFYKMETRRMEDGTLRLLPGKDPVKDVQAGDILQCVLVITADSPRQYVMVEDPVPAGCRITESGTNYHDYEWAYWYCGIVVRDDRVAFFARDLNKGANKITYMLRAETPGLSHALPTSVFNMYDPMNRASGAEGLLEIRE